jgi:hypothetical protein
MRPVHQTIRPVPGSATGPTYPLGTQPASNGGVIAVPGLKLDPCMLAIATFMVRPPVLLQKAVEQTAYPQE